MPQALEQLTAPDVGTQEMPFEQLKTGFFRRVRDHEGKVYYAGSWGRWTVHFPVLSDGTISRSGGQADIYPSQRVVVFNAQELTSMGITEAKLQND